MSENPAPVLVAEDDEHDVFFLEHAFEEAGIENRLIAVKNGQEAVWYLSGHAQYGDRERYPEPCLLLLDLKMPLMNGFDVLAWIREQPRWRDSLQRIVLSSSGYQADEERARELGAHEFFTKPNELSGLIELVSDIKQRYLTHNGADQT